MTATITSASDSDAGNPAGAVIKVALQAGDVQIVRLGGRDAVISAIPGNGGTLLVEASWSLSADVTGGSANWFAWAAGTVSAPTNQLLQKATAVRFTCSGVAGVCEIAR